MKERLIGAAILVALAVWLIPWVLDGGEQPAPLATTLELPVPEQAAPMRTHTIHLDIERSAPSSGGDAVVATAPARETPPVGTAAAPRPSPPSAGEPTRESGAVNEQESAPTPSVPQPAIAARSVEDGGSRGAEAAPTAGAPTTVASADAPAAVASTAAPPAPAPTPHGDWAVQLGSFGEEANARGLVQRVAAFGYQAEISNVRTNGRLLYRVRVGPHATRAQAEAAASALRAHGVQGQVVSLD